MDILILVPSAEDKKSLSKLLKSKGTVNAYKVVQSGIGKVESAITTTMELCNKRFDAVVLTGYCGATSSTSNVGAVAIPSKCLCYDFFNEDFNEETDTEFETLFGDGSLMLTGDQFVNGSTAKLLQSKHRDSQLYFDMEATGVCQACAAFCINPLIVKFVADIPDNGDNLETLREFSSKVDFGVIISFIENYFSDED